MVSYLFFHKEYIQLFNLLTVQLRNSEHFQNNTWKFFLRIFLISQQSQDWLEGLSPTVLSTKFLYMFHQFPNFIFCLGFLSWISLAWAELLLLLPNLLLNCLVLWLIHKQVQPSLQWTFRAESWLLDQAGLCGAVGAVLLANWNQNHALSCQMCM